MKIIQITHLNNSKLKNKSHKKIKLIYKLTIKPISKIIYRMIIKANVAHNIINHKIINKIQQYLI